MLLKVTGKILSDRNICIVPLFYRLHGIIIYIVIITHWYCYCHRIVPIIEITWILIVINNNIIEQLIPELEKLMEKITSLF